MKMPAVALAACLILAGISKGDVVTGTQNGSTAGTYSLADVNNAIGVSFSVPGSSAGNGNWAFKSLSFYLGTTSGTVTINSAVVSLFSANTSGGKVTTGSWLGNASGVLSSSSIGTSQQLYTVTWAEDSVFGNTTTKQGQGAGNYILGVTLNTSNASNVNIGTTTGAGQSATNGWQLVNNNWGSSQSYVNFTQSTTDFADTVIPIASNDNYAFTVTGTAVPEPGTLILGSIAAMGGAGGWWARRRRKAAADKADQQVAA